MISVEEALRIVLENQLPDQIIEVPLLEANGKVLAENIFADRDFPPFNRVAMDGIAINMSFLSVISEGDKLLIENIQFAGEPQKTMSGNGNCMEVMTGAILPENTDTVIRYEDLDFTEIEGRKYAIVNIPLSEPGQNVHHQGVDKSAQSLLIQQGTKISPAEIAIMATVGKDYCKVKAAPAAAVISTGDELVDIHENPENHQIRRSNSYMLAAALSESGIKARLYHLNDDPEKLENRLRIILAENDVLILSGGVSAGKKDFVPQIMESLGVKKLFHKVSQKPGKPFWFGKSEYGKIVFALPGNPGSTFLCFYKYVKPFLAGLKQETLKKAVLSDKIFFRQELTLFVPVTTRYNEEAALIATPLKNSGSGDLAVLLSCDGFLELPASEAIFEEGKSFNYINFK